MYCDYVIRIYKIENRYFLQVWLWPCYYHISSINHTKFENIMCDILEKMIIWVAVLPRVDQLTKVMPNFQRAVYVCCWCWCRHRWAFEIQGPWQFHDDVIKWKHFPRYWPFERGIHRSPVNTPHKGQWRGALMFSLIFARTNNWTNNGDAGNSRHHRAHYDIIVMHRQDCMQIAAPQSTGSNICGNFHQHSLQRRKFPPYEVWYMPKIFERVGFVAFISEKRFDLGWFQVNLT